MAEAEQKNRHALQRLGLRGEVFRTIGGMFSALLITLVMIGTSTYLVVNGYPWPGTLLGGGTLVSVVTVFLKTDDRDDDSAKSKRKK